MAKQKKKRWKCPRCEGGVLAPSRPRRNDVRRYCLPCSAQQGVLVERTCPALEAQRSAKYLERTAKKSIKESRDIKKWELEGYDIRQAVKPIAKMICSNSGFILPVGIPKRTRLKNVEVKMRRYRRSSGTSGRAGGNRMVLTVGDNLRDALYVIIHEFIHCLIGGSHAHDNVFKAVQRGAIEVWNKSGFREREGLPEVWGHKKDLYQVPGKQPRDKDRDGKPIQ